MPKIRPSRQQAAETGEAQPNRRDLAKIATEIKALERKDIKTIVARGRLLQEAADQAEHGEYMEWLKAEFGMSYRTAKRYRNVFELSENRQIADFEKLNISVSALYVVADMLDDCPTRAAILKAAQQRRVTYQEAKAISEAVEAAARQAEAKAEEETGKSEIVALLTEEETPKIEELQGKVQTIIDKYDELIPPIDDDADDSEENHCVDCGKNAEQAQAAGHTLMKCSECNGLGTAYGVWRCSECSQGEELTAKRRAKRNEGMAAHYANQFAKVAKFVEFVTKTGLWPEVIEQMGEERFRDLIAQMQAALDGGTTDPVKLKADRAEAKSRQVH